MKGFRVEQRYTFAAEDIAEATKRWEELDDAAEALGFHGEGGAMGEMKPSEINQGSPLARRLEAAR